MKEENTIERKILSLKHYQKYDFSRFYLEPFGADFSDLRLPVLLINLILCGLNRLRCLLGQALTYFALVEGNS